MFCASWCPNIQITVSPKSCSGDAVSLTALNTPPSLISGFDVVSALIPTSRSAPEILQRFHCHSLKLSRDLA